MNITPPSKKIEAIFEACLWKFRLFALIPVIFGLLSTLNFFVVGSIEILEGLSHSFPHHHADEHAFIKAVTSIIGGVDHYLIGVVLLLFSFGVYEIFISPIDIKFRYKEIKILEVNTLDGLKHKILQVVIMALIIGFFKRALSIAIESQQDLQSMAICILLIAVSSYLVHLQSHEEKHRETEVPTERRWREKYRQRPPGSAADLIANTVQPAISKRIEEEPTFYDKRRSDLEYFKSPQDMGPSSGNRYSDDALSEIRGDDDAIAFFGLLKPFIEAHLADAQRAEQITVAAAQAILDLIQQRAIRDWTNNDNIQDDMQTAIDDYLYEVICDKYRIDLTPGEMDEILEKSLQLAKNRPNLFQSRGYTVEKASSQAVVKRNQRQSRVHQKAVGGKRGW